MRDYVPRIHGAVAELVIVGNGTPEQPRWFVEDFHIDTPVFTDPVSPFIAPWERGVGFGTPNCRTSCSTRCEP